MSKEPKYCVYPNAVIARTKNKRIILSKEGNSNELVFITIDGVNAKRCKHTPIRNVGAQTTLLLSDEAIEHLQIIIEAYIKNIINELPQQQAL